MDSVSWCEIPEDIFLTIAARLHTVIDYLNVSRVCKPWRSTALSPLNLTIPSKPPFLMLAAESKRGSEEEEDEKNSSECLRGFVEFNNQGDHHKVFSLSLPEIHDDVRVMGSTGNWLILIDLKLDIFMFNPFTKTKLQFPSQSTLPDQLYDYDPRSIGGCDSDCDADCEGGHGITQEHLRNIFIQKAFLSSSNLSDVVMVIIFGASRRLAIARPGDLSWAPVQKEVDTLQCQRYVTDVIFFKGQFYSVNKLAYVAAYDICSTPPKAIQITSDCKIKNSDYKIKRFGDGSKYYLVEWLGKLLMVEKHLVMYDEEPFYKTEGFRVYMFDFNDKEWEEVTSLGKHSLFLGFNTSVSLLVSEHPPFKSNCIYFTDDNVMDYVAMHSEGGHDMGVFDLNDKTIKPHYNEVSTSFHSPPLWIIPQSIC